MQKDGAGVNTHDEKSSRTPCCFLGSVRNLMLPSN